MELERLLWAIHNLWDEWPALVGEDWPLVEAQILFYQSTIKAAGDDENARAIFRARLVKCFRPYPEARARLNDELKHGYTMRAAPTFGWPEAAMDPPMAVGVEPDDAIVEETVPVPASVTRYTDIACPRRVWVGTPRFVVTVRLTVKTTAASSDLQALTVQPDIPVRVRLDAPDFTLLDGIESDQEISVPATGDSSRAFYELRPRTLGNATLRFDFSQAGNAIGSASATVEVTAQEISESEEEPRWVGPIDFAAAGDTPPPQRILTVSYDEASRRLRFILDDADGTVRRFEQPLAMPPAATMEGHYKSLTALARSHDPQTQVFLNMEKALDAEEIDEEWMKIGRTLWTTLVPDDFKALYREQRDQWKDQSLLLLTSEPTIPWEILLPYGSGWKDKEPWCLTLAMTRWLHSDLHARGNPFGPRGALCLAPFGLLAPTYAGLNNLPHAHSEADELRTMLGEPLGPAKDNRAEVRRFLRGQPYTLMHIAAHGKFVPTAGGPEAAVLMGSRDLVMAGQWARDAITADLPLSPDSFNDPEIEALMAEHHPTYFLNACEVGRLAWGLTGAEGWAERLVTKGATAFIGPLWLANDKSARTFSLAFYRALREGKATLAEAARAARLEARAAGDPTWLAYSVYGHPNARVKG